MLAAGTGVRRCDEKDLLAVRAHDDAWGWRGTPLGRGGTPGPVHTPGDGAVLRVKSSRSRHVLMPGEWSWPVTGVLVVLVKPGVTGS